MPPIGRAVNEYPFRAIFSGNLYHPFIAHFRTRVDGKSCPVPPFVYPLHRLLIVVIDDHFGRIQTVLFTEIHAAESPLFFIPVRGVYQHQHIQLFGKVQLLVKAVHVLPLKQ